MDSVGNPRRYPRKSIRIMEAVAKLNNVPTSPRKMRLVADLVRGMDVIKALNLLKFQPNHASDRLEKLLMSAVANWQQKNEGVRLEDADLYVKTIFVGQGKTLRRMRPAPQGRGYRIRKRSNHVTLIVDDRLESNNEQPQTEKR
jgi:large subunit ribosomal protein L22